MNHARNYIDRGLDLGIVRCFAKMVAQQKLGLLPDWRVGSDPLDRCHSPGSRSDLACGPANAARNRSEGCIQQPSLEMFMKLMLIAGLVLVVLGIASFLIPIPHTETHGIKAGDVTLGVRTTHSERVSPVISVVLIAGGIALAGAGARTKKE